MSTTQSTYVGEGGYTVPVRTTILTFVGFSSLLAWLQTSEQLCLARDAAVHNGSFAAGVTFAVALLLYGLLNRLIAFEPSRRFIAATSAVAAACGIGYAVADGDGIRLLLFCLQTASCAVLAVSWGERLTRLTYRTLIPLACAAGACASSVLAACLLAPAPAALLVQAALPMCAGLCLLAKSNGDAPDVPTASSGPLTLDPIELTALRTTPWMLIAVISLCTLAAGLFTGMATNPYLANSHVVVSDMLIATLGGLAVMGIGGWAFFRWYVTRRTTERPESFDEPHVAIPFMHVSSSVAFILLIAGLLLFSTKLPGTMTAALGLVLGAKNCLVVLCWTLFPRAIADAKLPFVPCFALLVLGSGTLYASFLGAWVNKSMSIGFDALTSTATVLIAFIAVLTILYMAARVRHMSARQRMQEEPAAPAPLSLEEIRNALRAHQQHLMEPYGLTEREQQIVTMIIDGQTMGGIAEELFITERTVKFHSKNAYDKLGVHSKKELMQMFSDLPGAFEGAHRSTPPPHENRSA